MPIFNKQLRRTDFTDPQAALKEMANHIRYIQEQLEYTLMNLDSSNIMEINTDDTTIASGSSGSAFTGSSITLNGKNGEMFEAGVNKEGNFVFTVRGTGGKKFIYLDPGGELYIRNTNIVIDGGTW